MLAAKRALAEPNAPERVIRDARGDNDVTANSTCQTAKLLIHGKTPTESARGSQGSALNREDERQFADPDGKRERRMYSVSALNSAAIRRSLSFSSLSSAMQLAMFSTLLRS